MEKGKSEKIDKVKVLLSSEEKITYRLNFIHLNFIKGSFFEMIGFSLLKSTCSLGGQLESSKSQMVLGLMRIGLWIKEKLTSFLGSKSSLLTLFSFMKIVLNYRMMFLWGFVLDLMEKRFLLSMFFWLWGRIFVHVIEFVIHFWCQWVLQSFSNFCHRFVGLELGWRVPRRKF